jgi:hypothetical protein
MDDTVETDDLLARMNRNSPNGMRFIQALPLRDIKTLHPRRVTYEMHLLADQAKSLAERIEQLHRLPSWLVSRPVKTRRGRGRRPQLYASRDLDIKPMLAELKVTDRAKLRFVCVAHNDAWARPGEVLSLLGMTGPEQLARLRRVRLETDQAEQIKQNSG